MNIRFCVDCEVDLSNEHALKKYCDDCYKPHRNKYFAAYRKTDKHKKAIQRANDSTAGRARKRKYNHSIKGKIAHKKYRGTEKGKTSGRAQVLTRRVRQKNVEGGSLSAVEVRKVKNDYSSCAYCNSTEKLIIEHLIPVSRGGNNHPHNLVMACERCNIQKFDRTPDEFFLLYPKKKEVFLQLDLNRNKLRAINDPKYQEKRSKREKENWTQEKSALLYSMYELASREKILEQFPLCTWGAIRGKIEKDKKNGIIIPERFNAGRFTKTK